MANCLKSTIVVWYDTNVINELNQATREFFEANVGTVMVFNQKDEWKRFRERDFHKKRLILIITGQLGKEVVPQIHDDTNIISIYVYCSSKAFHEEWAKKHDKIKAVVTNLDELISEIISNPLMN